MEENIKYSLLLKGKEGELKIPCGNIQKVNLDLLSYGFEGTLHFWIGQKDLTLLYSAGITEAILTSSPTHAPQGYKETILKGILIDKSLLQEHTNENVSLNPVTMRLFSVHFKDPAQAIWTQHYPVCLYTQKSMQEVITLQQNSYITVNSEWEVLKKKQPMIALSQGWEGSTCSFYSFLMWFLEETKGVWQYDYATGEYAVLEKKKEDGDPIPLPPYGTEVAIHFPEPSRQHVQVLNSYALDPQTKKIPGNEAFDSVTRDYLLSTPILSQFETKAKEAQPLKTTFQHVLDLYLQQLPHVSFLPNDLISFSDSRWSEQAYYKKNIYRIRRVHVDFYASDLDFAEESEKTSQVYQGRIEAFLELKDETSIHRPPFSPPLYPFEVEGIIVSEVGEKEELTFQIGKDGDTNQMHYTVEIPLWEKQKITIPFESVYTFSQFYFPLCKGERVMISLHLFHAHIKKVLAWWERSKWPTDTQGNRIVFTPKKEESHTLIEHSDDNGKHVLTIERKSDKQIQVIHVKEEGLFIEIREDGETDHKSLVHMDNNFAITLMSQNKQSGNTQTVKIEDGKITSVSQGKKGTSSYTQTPDQIAVKCKKFLLETEETTLISKEKTVIKSDNTMVLEAKKELSEKAQAIAITAEQTFNQGATTIELTGKSEIKQTAKKVVIQGTISADLLAKVVKIKGNSTSIEGMIKLN